MNISIAVPIFVWSDRNLLTVVAKGGCTVPDFRVPRRYDIEFLNLYSVFFPTGVLPTDSLAASVVVPISDAYPSQNVLDALAG